MSDVGRRGPSEGSEEEAISDVFLFYALMHRVYFFLAHSAFELNGQRLGFRAFLGQHIYAAKLIELIDRSIIR